MSKRSVNDESRFNHSNKTTFFLGDDTSRSIPTGSTIFLWTSETLSIWKTDWIPQSQLRRANRGLNLECFQRTIISLEEHVGSIARDQFPQWFVRHRHRKNLSRAFQTKRRRTRQTTISPILHSEEEFHRSIQTTTSAKNSVRINSIFELLLESVSLSIRQRQSPFTFRQFCRILFECLTFVLNVDEDERWGTTIQFFRVIIASKMLGEWWIWRVIFFSQFFNFSPFSHFRSRKRETITCLKRSREASNYQSKWRRQCSDPFSSLVTSLSILLPMDLLLHKTSKKVFHSFETSLIATDQSTFFWKASVIWREMEWTQRQTWGSIKRLSRMSNQQLKQWSRKESWWSPLNGRDERAIRSSDWINRDVALLLRFFRSVVVAHWKPWLEVCRRQLVWSLSSSSGDSCPLDLDTRQRETNDECPMLSRRPSNR